MSLYWTGYFRVCWFGVFWHLVVMWCPAHLFILMEIKSSTDYLKQDRKTAKQDGSRLRSGSRLSRCWSFINCSENKKEMGRKWNLQGNQSLKTAAIAIWQERPNISFQGPDGEKEIWVTGNRLSALIKVKSILRRLGFIRREQLSCDEFK